MSARRGGARRRKGLAAMTAVAAMLSSSVAWAPWADAGPSCKSRKVSCTTDTVRPTVSVSSPASGAAVAGTITVAGTASDNVSVSGVDVSVDGVAVGRASGTTSWSIALDTTRYANGSRTISAVAVDAAGNAGSSAVTVTVQNAAPTPSPPRSPSPPRPGARPSARRRTEAVARRG